MKKVILILAGVFCSTVASYAWAHYGGRLYTLSRAKALIKPRQACCTQDVDKPHLLAASYYSVKDNLTANLMLNNKGPEPVEITPTLFSLTGERLDVPAVTVAGESFRNIDLRELGALPGTPFEQGSIQLFHRGPDLVIGSQLYLVDEARSLSFDEKLSEFQLAASNQLESVWWLPSQESTTTLILSNTSDLEVTARVLVQMGKGRAQEINPTLKPHETQLIVLKPENSGNKRRPRNQAGSASITHSGAKGAILARTLVEDFRTGYSFSAQFYWPQAGKSSGYQGVGLRLGTATGENLNPIVVARNIADVETYLTGRMPYTTADGRDGVVELPKIRLSAGEAQSLDIQRVIAKAIASENISTASLEFDYTTAPGTVLMVTQSVSDDANQVFRVPMWDVPAQRNGTGGYPWFIEGDSSTFVYIKNVTDEEQRFTFSLTYDGGDYSLGVKTIKPHQTVAYDLRALRDNQVPDERNQTIPVSATRGKLVWSVRGRNSLALLGRSEQVDLVKGISSSYACFMCCPNSFRSSNITPINFGLNVDAFTTVRGVERDSTCYGGLTPQYYWGDTWSVDNPSIASIDGFGDSAEVTGITDGIVNVTAQWEVFTYTFEHNLDGPYCVESSDMTQPQGPVQVLRLRWNTPRVNKVGTQDVGLVPLASGSPPANSLAYVKTTTITAIASPTPGEYLWSTTSDKVTLSNTSSVTVTVTSVSESAEKGDVKIKLKYTLPNGRSAEVEAPFTVQKPTSMVFVSKQVPGNAKDCSAGLSGSKKSITWQVSDKFGDPIPFRLPLFDTMNNNANNCFVPPQGEGTDPGKGTDEGGKWPHNYGLCSTMCNNGGSCTVTGTQKYFIQGFEIDLGYTMTCSSITVAGQ